MVRRVTLAAAIFWAALAGGAQAACPDNSKALAVALAEKAQTGDVGMVNSLENLAVACPQDGHVQYLTFWMLTNFAGAYPIASDERRVTLVRAMNAYMRFLPVSAAQPVLVMTSSGQPTNLSLDNQYKIAGGLMNLVVDTEIATKFDTATLALKAAPKACLSEPDAQQIAFAFRRKGQTIGGRAILDRVAACGVARDRFVWRALALLAAAPFEPDLVKRKAMLEQVSADKASYLGDRPSGLFWGKTEDDKFDLLMLDLTPDPPEAVWFTKDWVGKPVTQRAIARKLDSVWAGEITVDGTKPYRDAMGAMYSASFKAPDIPAARAMILAAAKDHAEGRVRSEKSKAFKAPPEFMYNWVVPKAP
jgi:hypothetical protein